MSGGGNDTPPPTEQEIALADVATKKLQVYKDNYEPLEKTYLDNITATDAKRESAAGLTSASIRQAAGEGGKTQYQAGLGAGVSGNSGRNIFARRAVHDATSSALAGGTSRAVQGIEDRQMQGRLNYVGLGHGVAGTALQTATSRAQNATQLAISDAKADYTRGQGIRQAVGTGAGFYVRHNMPE